MVVKSKLRVKAFGVEELQRAMDRFGGEVTQAVDKAIKETAVSTCNTAKSLAPEDTRALRSGIIVRRFATRKDTLKVWDVGMDPKMNAVFRKPIKNPKGKRKDAYYPTVIEYGTAHTPAQPFLRPAMKKHRSQAKKAMTRLVREAINRNY